MKAVEESEGVTRQILFLDTRRRQIISFSARCFTPSTDRIEGSVIRTARFGEQKVSASCSNPYPVPFLSLDRPSHYSHYGTPAVSLLYRVFHDFRA